MLTIIIPTIAVVAIFLAEISFLKKMDASGHTQLSEYLYSMLPASEVKRLIDVLQGRTEKKAIVITGPQGPTGKTTLSEVLKKSGYPVFEAYQVHEIRLDKPIAKPVPINSDDIISDVIEFWSTPNFCSDTGKKLTETCKCWVKGGKPYNCGYDQCPGFRLPLIEKRLRP